MKVLCAGLSKTGTTSLHHALTLLGYKSVHCDQVHLNDLLAGRVVEPNFRIYDDYGAVSDLPSAYFFRELLDAYPNAKVILTVREVNSWFESIEKHFSVRRPVRKPNFFLQFMALLGFKFAKRRAANFEFRTNVRNLCYGSVYPREYIYKARYEQHNKRVQCEVPAEQLLVLNLGNGDGWEKLCPFLEKKVPSDEFPRSNKAEQGGTKIQRILRHLVSGW